MTLARKILNKFLNNYGIGNEVYVAARKAMDKYIFEFIEWQHNANCVPTVDGMWLLDSRTVTADELYNEFLTETKNEKTN